MGKTHFFGPISVKFRSRNFFSYHYLYQKTFQILQILHYFANFGASLIKLGARGKFPPLPPPPKGFHKLLEILIIVAQKRKKSCPKLPIFHKKLLLFNKVAQKLLLSTAILTFEQF
jgi:hypothetical protein